MAASQRGIGEKSAPDGCARPGSRCASRVYRSRRAGTNLLLFVGLLISQVTKQVNDVYRALSDPTRRRILAILRDGDLAAGDLAARFELAWPTVSGHLKVLRDADLVQADRHGTSISYHLNVSVLEEALASLMDALGIGAREAS